MARFGGIAVAVFLAVCLGAGAAAWRTEGWVEDLESGLAQARAAARPAFVYFDAPWCSWCQQYERETLRRPRVRAALERDYVPIVVNYDARPDLFQRFGGKGLPFTVILSPRGEVLNRFVGVMAPDDLFDLLVQFRVAAPAAPPDDFGAAPAVRVTALDRSGYASFRRAFLGHVEALYEERLGTLVGRFESGATLKRPSPLTWMYLHRHGLWPGRTARAARVERERLHDPLNGGFFNFLDPSREEYLESSKILEANAWLSAWLAEMGRTDRAARRAAYSGWFFLRETLWDWERGGFWQAQVADTAYYRTPPAQRLRLALPPIDRLKRADTNAQAAWALMHLGETLGQAAMQDYGARALDFVLTEMLRHGRLHHVWREDGLGVADLPADWFWVLAAGIEVERLRPDGNRRARLRTLARIAADWLTRRMAAPAAEPLPVELAGLIAWVAAGPHYPVLPAGAQDWALRQLRIEAETPPDDLVLGLRAWEAALARQRS